MSDSLVTELTPVIDALNSKKLAVANNLSDLNNVSTARTNLGLGTSSTQSSTSFATAAQGTIVENIYAVNGIVKSNSSGVFTSTNNSDITTLIGTTTYDAYGTAASLLVGVIRDCGNYDASVNLWPNSGGTGIGGTIVKGDLWFISVAGTLGTTNVTVGASIRALVDTPGQTNMNWDILPTNYGYVPENAANKVSYSTVSVDYTSTASDIKYPSVKSVYTFINNTISSLGLGTSSTYAYTAFDPAGSAATAQSNAEAYASNANNLSTGTLAISRFPNLNSTNIWIGNSSNIPTQLPIAGDGTLSSAGVLTITKTNGNTFATSATIDTTNATNISSGTLNINRLPSLIGLTYNGLSLVSNSIGFTASGGAVSKYLTISNSIILSGTDGSTLNIGSGGSLGSAAYQNTSYFDLANSAANAQLAAITSANTYTNNAITALSLGTASTYSSSSFASSSQGTIAINVANVNGIVYSNGSNIIRAAITTDLTVLLAGQYDSNGLAASALTSANAYASNASNLSTGIITTTVIPVLPSSLIPLLSTSQIPALTSNQFVGTLNTTQIPAITSNQIQGLIGTSQIPSLTSNQLLGTLSTNQIPALTSSQVISTLGATIYDVYGAATSAQINSLQVANNLSDLNNVSTARTNLGLGSAAVYSSSSFAPSTANIGYVLGQNDSVTGTTSKLITSIIMQAATYSSIFATLGCLLSTDTATLTVYNGTTLLATLSNTGTPVAVSTTAFTLSSISTISFYLTGSASTTNSFIYGIEIK